MASSYPEERMQEWQRSKSLDRLSPAVMELLDEFIFSFSWRLQSGRGVLLSQQSTGKMRLYGSDLGLPDRFWVAAQYCSELAEQIQREIPQWELVQLDSTLRCVVVEKKE